MHEILREGKIKKIGGKISSGLINFIQGENQFVSNQDVFQKFNPGCGSFYSASVKFILVQFLRKVPTFQ